jgi:PIN domain nuclease of toxin-antitoxin system
VKLLLDTHIFIWWNSSPDLIAPPLRAAIRQPGNGIFVSAASVWEIAIKRAIGKLIFTGVVVEVIGGHRFELLPILGEHAECAGALPQHHTDPFDRMLVAQAQLEGLVLGTQDRKLRPYSVAVLGL